MKYRNLWDEDSKEIENGSTCLFGIANKNTLIKWKCHPFYKNTLMQWSVLKIKEWLIKEDTCAYPNFFITWTNETWFSWLINVTDGSVFFFCFHFIFHCNWLKLHSFLRKVLNLAVKKTSTMRWVVLTVVHYLTKCLLKLGQTHSHRLVSHCHY